LAIYIVIDKKIKKKMRKRNLGNFHQDISKGASSETARKG
jgi:hypothetical protein